MDLNRNGPSSQNDLPSFSAPILVAEDNPVNQQVMALLFKRLLIPYEFASNGQNAIDRFAAQKYRLILMDIQMPQMDGIEATHIIRSSYPAQQQPIIIALTGESEEDSGYFKNLGFDDYLKKPIKPDALKAVISRYLNRNDSGEEPLQPPPDLSSSATQALPGAAFDDSVIDELISDIGDGGAEIIGDLINTYLNHTPTLFAAMRQAFAQNDLNTIYRSAHTLKSSSANLGAMALSELSRQLEEQLKPVVAESLSPLELDRIKLEINQKVQLMQASFDQISIFFKDYQVKLSGKGTEGKSSS
jgi:CheY-like chemotaxis protein/HPt (histidine-containing phosphotransfer) domain-containing protein